MADQEIFEKVERPMDVAGKLMHLRLQLDIALSEPSLKEHAAPLREKIAALEKEQEALWK